ncbi:hypothetical protein KSP40_PGU020316 [Platanthera guangdongensis]|uniref:Uncharacterized protein n=1 Tax=Platanthera guangdongensis TaxID=2320717 RepID=A0ABR2MPV7_9ASPA
MMISVLDLKKSQPNDIRKADELHLLHLRLFKTPWVSLQKHSQTLKTAMNSTSIVVTNKPFCRNVDSGTIDLAIVDSLSKESSEKRSSNQSMTRMVR